MMVRALRALALATAPQALLLAPDPCVVHLDHSIVKLDTGFDQIRKPAILIDLRLGPWLYGRVQRWLVVATRLSGRRSS